MKEFELTDLEKNELSSFVSLNIEEATDGSSESEYFWGIIDGKLAKDKEVLWYNKIALWTEEIADEEQYPDKELYEYLEDHDESYSYRKVITEKVTKDDIRKDFKEFFGET